MKTNRRAYHHGDLKKAYLEAAEKTLKISGINGLSLRELSREIGVSNSASRRHFENRKALLDALAVEGFERLQSTLERSVSNTAEDFETRIVKLGRAYVRFAIKNSALIGLMFTAKHADDAPAELITASDRAFASGPLTIAEGQKDKAVVDGDSRHLALPVFAALEGLVTMSTNGKFQGIPLDALVIEVIQRIIVGLRPR